MKRAIMVLAVLTLVAFAGDFATGGAELTKFKGYGTFSWTMYGEEGANPANDFSDYVWMAWLPRINDNVDFCISAKHSQTNGLLQFDAMYLNMDVTDAISVMGGQFKRPFGYAYTRSGGSMYFADRSLITIGSFDDGEVDATVDHFNKFGGLDIGAMATVEFAPVTVDLMISNGTGANANADTTCNKQFTARLAVDPTEWLTVGGSFAMVGTPEMADSVDAVSANGMDFFAVADYAVNSTGTLRFVGEYMILGADDNMDDATAGNGMSVMAGYDIDLDGEVLVGIMPAVRYDAVTPIDNTGNATDTGISRLDFCVNLGLFSNLNTLQVGMRNYGAEVEGFDSYTDIYANWRMNF